ncbi:MAG: MBL fold metallo-hydrolase [Methanobacteriota archaeon]|nr:MAG: MBL fold metallo-hydrolase [Euryarchaeota archaeon]
MHDSFVAVLSSGSCGNSVFVRSRDAGILVDAGISCREIERRLGMFGAEPAEVDAVLLTHEHTDHNRGARRFCSVHEVPMFGTEGTLSLTPHDGAQTAVFRAGGDFAIGDIDIRSVPVDHLASDPVAFTIKTDGRKVSVISDLGRVTADLKRSAEDSDLLMVEANYDEEMLRSGTYPEFLKRTILSENGHLSNEDAARLCADAACESTARVVLLHMSRENNQAELAEGAVVEALRHKRLRPKVEPTEYGSHNGPFGL